MTFFIHPGIILKQDYIDEMDINVKSLAEAIDIPPSGLYHVTKGERDITADLSILLGQYFDISGDMFYNMQRHYNFELAKSNMKKRRLKRVVPYKDHILDERRA